jgi:hypothetical protein
VAVVLLAATGAVVAAQVPAAPALAATATVSPAGIDWAPGSTSYQDILVPAAAWAAQDQFLVSVPDVGVKIDVRSEGNNGFDCSPTQATNAPTEYRCRLSKTGTSLRVYYGEYGAHQAGIYGKSFTMTATDVTTGDVVTGEVRVRPKADLKLWGPYAEPGQIVVSVDDKAGPSAADGIQVRLSVTTGHLVAQLPSNCAGTGSTIVCDFGSMERTASLKQVVLLALPGTTGFITIVGTITGTWPDPNSANNSGTAGPWDPMGGPGPMPTDTPTDPGSTPNPAPGGAGSGGGGGPGSGAVPGAGSPSAGVTAAPSTAADGDPTTGPAAATTRPAQPVVSVPARRSSRSWAAGTAIAVGAALLFVGTGWWWRRRRLAVPGHPDPPVE